MSSDELIEKKEQMSLECYCFAIINGKTNLISWTLQIDIIRFRTKELLHILKVKCDSSKTTTLHWNPILFHPVTDCFRVAYINNDFTVLQIDTIADDCIVSPLFHSFHKSNIQKNYDEVTNNIKVNNGIEIYNVE